MTWDYSHIPHKEGEAGEMPLYEVLCAAHSHDDAALLTLIEQFSPMLRKRARQLDYEDSYDDLVADFIALIYSMKPETLRSEADGVVVGYFVKAVYHCYARRLRRKIDKIPEIAFSGLSEAEQYMLEAEVSVEDEYFRQELTGDGTVLTQREELILQLVFVWRDSVEEIAARLGVSRQAVNQAKNRALGKLGKADLAV